MRESAGKLLRFLPRLQRATATKGIHGGYERLHQELSSILPVPWARFWMQWAGLTPRGRLATWMATRAPLPYLEYYARYMLAELAPPGYIALGPIFRHPLLTLAPHVFIDDQCCIVQDLNGGPNAIGEHSRVSRHASLSTGQEGSIRVGGRVSIGEGCTIAAYKAGIAIGDRVLMAADYACYSFNHQIQRGRPICDQPLVTRGPILIEDEVWLGHGVTVLSEVVVGKGAVIGAGSVVTRNIPPYAIAADQPARVLRFRPE